MSKIIRITDNHSVGDNLIEEWYQSQLEYKLTNSICVSSGIQLQRLQLGMARGDLVIDHLFFNGEKYPFNADGTFSWPKDLFPQMFVINSAFILEGFQDAN